MISTILIADDDPVQRRLLEAMIRRFGYEAETVESGDQALARLERPEGPAIDLLILDLVMPDLDGMGVLAKMRERKIGAPVIVQTAHGSIEAVISAMRAGAYDFVVKPVGAERLQFSIKNALRADALEEEIRRINRRATGTLTFKDLVFSGDEMARIIRLGERAAKSTIPVLLEGESGVGKELVARAVQGGSDRKGRSFVTVNCGALPENLVESILFGHEKGAFTGAVDKHVGKFQEANGGTLFLDEIGDMPMDAQTRLLRVLQQGEYTTVGGRTAIKTNVRIVAATNRDLRILINQGLFREDLYYRLNVVPLRLPPLRERIADIPDLVHHFFALAAEEGLPRKEIDSAALERLKRHRWPGNVRELENLVRRLAALYPQETISDNLIELELAQDEPAPAAAADQGEQRLGTFVESYLGSYFGGFGDSLPPPGLYHRFLREVEPPLISAALTATDGNQIKAAELLGLNRNTLRKKIRDLNIRVIRGAH